MIFKMWVCSKCGFEIEQTRVDLKTKDALALNYENSIPKCPSCNIMLKREDQSIEPENYARRVCDKERRSVAMGIRPEDIPIAMKKFPGSRYDKTGVLLLSGYREKKVRMKQRGYCEY